MPFVLELILASTCIGFVVGALACLCATRKSYRAFVVGVVALGFGVALFAYLYDARHFATSASRMRLYAAYEALSVAPLVVLFLFLPGLMVRQGASLRWILATSIATSIVASPFYVCYNLILMCSIGIDCL